MHAIAYRLLALVLVAALAGWGGFRFGAKVERAEWLAAEQQRTHAAAETARLAAQAESRRAAASQAERDRLARRIKALTDAAARDRIPATECRIGDAEQRLLDAELDAYRATHAGTASPVHDAVRPDAGADGLRLDQPARPARPASLGLRLSDAASRVHWLDQ